MENRFVLNILWIYFVYATKSKFHITRCALNMKNSLRWLDILHTLTEPPPPLHFQRNPQKNPQVYKWLVENNCLITPPPFPARKSSTDMINFNQHFWHFSRICLYCDLIFICSLLIVCLLHTEQKTTNKSNNTNTNTNKQSQHSISLVT